MEDPQDVELDQLPFLIVAQRPGADEDIEVLPLDHLGGLAGHLLGCEMGKQVGHAEDRIVRILSHPHRHGGTVPQHHHAVEGQGDGGPLVFFDPAVIMSVEIGQVMVLIQGIGLEVEAGRIDMRRSDGHAVGNGTGTDHREQQGLIPVIDVHPVPGFEGSGPVKGDKPRLLRHFDGFAHRFPLGLGRVHKGFVPLAVRVGPADFLLRHGLGHELRLIPERLLELLGFGFFRHVVFLLFYTPSVFTVCRRLCGRTFHSRSYRVRYISWALRTRST